MAPPPTGVVVRVMTPEDLPATADLWVAAWQAAYPSIDFTARRTWFLTRITDLQAAGTAALVATRDGRIVGVVTVEPHTGYIDQLAVATQSQRTGVAAALLSAAREKSAAGLALHVNQDNERAIRFYEEQGFVRTGSTVNAQSGAPTYAMAWRPETPG